MTFISIHFVIICDVLIWRTYETHPTLSLKSGCDNHLRLSATVAHKFLPITFLHHIINISPPTFSSPAAVLSKFSSIPHNNYKILFFIPIFQQLSFFPTIKLLCAV
jgi:hypothetical protein